MDNILDIFYNEIIEEASNGIVEAYFTHNVLFNTMLEGKVITSIKDNDRLVPTLIIDDPKEFNVLLKEYIKLAYPFYYEYYCRLVLDADDKEYFQKNYLKSLITLLWSNATNDDFLNPCEYLKKRISFFAMKEDNQEFDSSLGRVDISLQKDKLVFETPYCLSISINGNEMPKVNIGIHNDTAYIYAIQNTSKESRDKDLNRKLYKINQGIDLEQEEKDNIEHPENLRGVTPSTVISATIALAYIKKQGISKISIPTFLIVRWNSKEITNYKKTKFVKIYDELEKEHEEIQRNITDKFIRTFRRIAYHFEGIDVVAYPYMEDTNMHLVINDNLECNNDLLNELFNSVIEDKFNR